jgi:hypothetical protein
MWQDWLKGFGLPECRNETPFASQRFSLPILSKSPMHGESSLPLLARTGPAAMSAALPLLGCKPKLLSRPLRSGFEFGLDTDGLE